MERIENFNFKSGMLITIEHDDTPYIITSNYCDKLIAVSKKGRYWMDLESSYSLNRIKEIYDRPRLYASTLDFSASGRELLWKKETKKREMTVAEIEKELGFGIKIVKE